MKKKDKKNKKKKEKAIKQGYYKAPSERKKKKGKKKQGNIKINPKNLNKRAKRYSNQNRFYADKKLLPQYVRRNYFKRLIEIDNKTFRKELKRYSDAINLRYANLKSKKRKTKEDRNELRRLEKEQTNIKWVNEKIKEYADSDYILTKSARVRAPKFHGRLDDKTKEILINIQKDDREWGGGYYNRKFASKEEIKRIQPNDEISVRFVAQRCQPTYAWPVYTYPTSFHTHPKDDALSKTSYNKQRYGWVMEKTNKLIKSLRNEKKVKKTKKLMVELFRIPTQNPSAQDINNEYDSALLITDDNIISYSGRDLDGKIKFGSAHDAFRIALEKEIPKNYEFKSVKDLERKVKKVRKTTQKLYAGYLAGKGAKIKYYNKNDDIVY